MGIAQSFRYTVNTAPERQSRNTPDASPAIPPARPPAKNANAVTAMSVSYGDAPKKGNPSNRVKNEVSSTPNTSSNAAVSPHASLPIRG